MQVLMYCKRDCNCCESARRKLMLAAYDHDLAVACQDISDDPALMAKYGNDVPVVFFDGKLRFRREINTALLKKLLASAPARV